MRCVLGMWVLFLGLSSTVVAEPLPRRGVLGVAFTPVPANLATELKLKPDEGLLTRDPAPGSTASKAGIRSGDVIVAINDKPVALNSIASFVRDQPAGKEITFSVYRDGKLTQLKSELLEKARDPGTEKYAVEYSHIESHGKRMRTIITTPKAAGKHRAVLFIQGFSPVSYDYTLQTAKGDVSTIDGPILHQLASSGLVTLRVEKPGVGDSEGGPYADLDYKTELDTYLQALKQLKSLDSVDADNVFIFGHSMGGAFGPMIACEVPVRGLAVYGVAARTWYEYLLDTLRYQGLVAGDTFENTDEKVRLGSQLMALVFLENQSIDAIKKSHPQLAALADAVFPGGLFNGKTLEFWRQLQQVNFANYWAQCNAHVLAVRGASDFVTYDVDHRLVADIVNAVHPGWGKSLVLENADHLFHNFATERESMQNFQRGQCNPSFAKVMIDWIDDISKKDSATN